MLLSIFYSWCVMKICIIKILVPLSQPYFLTALLEVAYSLQANLGFVLEVGLGKYFASSMLRADSATLSLDAQHAQAGAYQSSAALI